MKQIIHNIITLIIAFVGFFGGLLWGIKSNWDYEPIILLIISFLEIIAFFVLPKSRREGLNSISNRMLNKPHNTNNQNIEINQSDFDNLYKNPKENKSY